MQAVTLRYINAGDDSHGMMGNSRAGIICDADALAEDYVPVEVPGREHQIAELKRCMWPVVKKARPLHAWLYGGAGVGKTSVAKHVLAKLQTEMGVQGVYVNCWEHSTLYAVADKVVYDLRLLRADRTASVVKLEVLMRHLGRKPFILVLDEIDKPLPRDRNTILYNLLALPYAGLVCVCNSRADNKTSPSNANSTTRPHLLVSS